ncbi:MAG: helix-turn-helix domain-containing protein [Phycisphaerae bacterium]
MPEIRRRIHRRLTAAERRRHQMLLAEVAGEESAIKARGRAVIEAHDHLQQTLQKLKAVRTRRGLSLMELSRRSGIDRARLSRLESDAHANPTLNTVNCIASALGVELRIAIVSRGPWAARE